MHNTALEMKTISWYNEITQRNLKPVKQFVKQDNLQRISKNEGFFNPYPPSPFPRKGGEYGGWRPSALLGALPQTPSEYQG